MSKLIIIIILLNYTIVRNWAVGEISIRKMKKATKMILQNVVQLGVWHGQAKNRKQQQQMSWFKFNLINYHLPKYQSHR